MSNELSNAQILDARIDAFTATSSIVGNRTRAKIFIRELALTLTDLYFPFELQKPLTQMGATGYSKGSLKFLNFWDKDKKIVGWNMVGVTGMHSQDAFELAYSYEQDFKVTRLDIAVDVALPAGLDGWLKGLYEKLSEYNKSLRYLSSSSGDTMYINSRQSGRMARIYDKSAKYNLELGRVYRFEIEAKKVDAEKLTKLLRSGKDLKAVALDYASKVFASWAVPFPYTGNEIIIPKIQMAVTSDFARLEWLASISGAIRRLKELYPEQVNSLLATEQDIEPIKQYQLDLVL